MRLAAVLPAVAMSVVAGTALVLAMVGAYRFWLNLVLSVPLTCVLGAVVFVHSRASSGTRRADIVAAMAAVVIAAISFGLYGHQPSQYTFIDQDPGAYSATARWIARSGSLRADAAVGPFATAPNLTFESPAVYDTGGGHLEFQFDHLASAAMAVAFDAGGEQALFRLSAFCTAAALLPIYVLGCGLLRRAWLSVAVMTMVAVSVPFVWTGRGTYSEPYTLLPLAAGMVTLCWLWKKPRVGLALVAGALVGTTVMARIDGVAYLFPLLPFAALLWGRRRRVVAAALLIGAAVPTLIGAIDLHYLSGRYGQDFDSQRALLDRTLVLIAVLCLVALLAQRRSRGAWDRLVRSRVGVVFGGLCGAAFLAGWLLRPALVTVRRPEEPYIERLQRAAGLAVDGTHSYWESSLRWIGWYVGAPAMVLAALGCGTVVWRMLSRRAAAADGVVVSFLALAGVIYVWAPSITGYQIWAMRRYVPLVLPGIALLAGVGVDRILTVSSLRFGRLSAGLVGAAGALLLVVPAGAATVPVRELREQAGFLRVAESACGAAGRRGVFVVTGSFASVVPQTLRSWCGAPTAIVTPNESLAELQALARAWGAECRPLILVAAPASAITRYRTVVGPVAETPTAINPRRLERTLVRRPDGYVVERLSLGLAVVDAPNRCTS
jgi:hypothetical protein